MRGKVLIVEPMKSINGVAFGTDRKTVRKAFKGKYREIKKTIFSENTMDSYRDFNLYYTKEDELEAVEMFGGVKVTVGGKQIFPGTVGDVKSVFPGMKPADEGFIDAVNSVAITVEPDDDNVIESVLFGARGYYSND